MRMSWVGGTLAPVGCLPEGSCIFVQVDAELPLWALVALCGTCPGCSGQKNLLSMSWLCGSIHLSCPCPLKGILSLFSFRPWRRLPPSILVIALVASACLAPSTTVPSTCFFSSESGCLATMTLSRYRLLTRFGSLILPCFKASYKQKAYMSFWTGATFFSRKATADVNIASKYLTCYARMLCATKKIESDWPSPVSQKVLISAGELAPSCAGKDMLRFPAFSRQNFYWFSFDWFSGIFATVLPQCVNLSPTIQFLN